MDKTFFKQRFNYAEILPYKNYSTLADRKNNSFNTFNTEDTVDEIDEVRLFGEEKMDVGKNPLLRSYESISLYSKENYMKKNTKFFYSGIPDIGIKIPVKFYFKKHKSFITDKDKHIKNHYNRPFSAISTHTYERIIDLTDEKLSVRYFHSQKNRPFNSVFFKKNWFSDGFSLNLKTGDFYTFTVTKKGTKRIRKNSFVELKQMATCSKITNFNSIITNATQHEVFVKYGIPSEKKIYWDVRNNFANAFDNLEFSCALFDVFKNKLNLQVQDSINEDWIYNTIVSFFISKKGIKVPNEYEKLISNWYPTVKYLRKNDNKLVVSILDRLGLKSKHLIKLVHEHPNIDLFKFRYLKLFFGNEDLHKYLGNLNSNILTTTHELESYMSSYERFTEVTRDDVTENEKYVILRLLNDFADRTNEGDTKDFTKKLYEKFKYIEDHLKMVRKIKNHFDNVEFRATNWELFHEEHLQFSRLQSLISRGYSVEFVYDEKLVNLLEEPIIDSGTTFYPIILKKDMEYTEEGRHMHHCVGGYSEYSSSMIISVREKSKHSDSRVTCEYNTYNKTCSQERSFCNKTPPEQFLKPLEILRKRVSDYNGSIAAKEKVKTPFTKEKMLEIAGSIQPIQPIQPILPF